MPLTQVNTGQLADNAAVQRSDLCVSGAGTSGKTVIAKAIQGTGLVFTSTGTDAGTGDVTMNLATPVAVTNGGTGFSAVNQGDLVYASAANTLATLAKNATATRYISNGGLGNNPSWAQVNLANGVTGTLATGNLPVSSDFGFTTQQTIVQTDAATNTVTNNLIIGHDSSSAASTDFGVGMTWEAKTATVSGQDMARLNCAWSNATDANRTAYMDFLLINNASGPSSKMRLHGSGGLSVGHTTDPTTGYISANTGFKVGASALAFSHLSGNIATTQMNSGTGANSTAVFRGDGTWGTQKGLFNASTSSQTITTTDTYLTGSTITIAAGDITAGTMYHCLFYVSKAAAAGTVSLTYHFRGGTLGTTSDTSLTGAQSPGVQTAVASAALIEFYAIFSGSSATATVNYFAKYVQSVANGLFPSAAGATALGTFTGSGTFNNTGYTKLGISFNGANATNYVVYVLKAELIRP